MSELPEGTLGGSWWGRIVPSRGWLLGWGKEIARFFSWQVAIMALNLAAGILIIRYLPKAEYALYTVGFVAMSMFTNITDAGISPAITALAGRHWQDRWRMGSVVRTAIAFRKVVGVAFALPIAAYGLWQFRLIDAGWSAALSLTAVFAIGGMIGLETSILRVPIVFAKRIAELQRFELWVAVAKLLGIIAVGLVLPSALTLALVSIASVALGWRLLRGASREHADVDAPVDADVRARIVELFRPNIAAVVYWAFQGQITILLCSLFGTTENVAEIGALGKLTLAFGILGTFVSSYLLPKVAKAERPREILATTGLILGVYLAASASLLLVAALAPSLYLWVLGEQYANLTGILLLYVGVSLVGVFRLQVYGLCMARGWVKKFVWYAPVAIATQVIALLAMGLDSLRDIVLFEGVVSTVILALTVGVFCYEYLVYQKGCEVAQNVS